MTMKIEYRASVTIGALIAASLTVSGCMGPTYGTDKSSTEQLIDDFGSIASIGQPRKGAGIEYKPRPDIVKPSDTSSLPAPQQNLAENNPAWVESPEQTRARLIAEADGNADGATYTSPLARRAASSGSSSGPAISGGAADGPPTPQDVMNQARQREQYQSARKIQQGAYSDRRRFLSDPPLTYRKPAETAPVGDLGEPERVKERRRISEAKKAGTGKRSWWPW
ncbi:hypothetical protein PZ897_01180 [Hoeflea sp. YIM 152468]|uniref:hypothetical protein n=1 Tax=Hoeflea sp. YIM 152468 TaxID=3031759 RepID=UPI0023DA0FCC|nr:hypothetical protein [Hoeflea sp. YIM 152468]MDF1606780.1 hypothetical protein [Hoeflea sp. YIM 152468]